MLICYFERRFVSGMMQLDFAGRMMRENPQLVLAVACQTRKRESPATAAARMQAIVEYLETRWQIPREKIRQIDDLQDEGEIRINFAVEENRKDL